MNPLMMLGLLGKGAGMIAGGGPNPGAAPGPAVAPPRPIPDGSNAAEAAVSPGLSSIIGNMMGLSPEQMASVGGTLRSPSDPERPPQPGVVSPESGRAMNPQFTQQLIQQLMMNNQPQGPQASLGQMLAGLGR
jgi:hypothetical protein